MYSSLPFCQVWNAIDITANLQYMFFGFFLQLQTKGVVCFLKIVLMPLLNVSVLKM